jgi:prepilin-type N-terminal cleavage/methylation domain-containing protein
MPFLRHTVWPSLRFAGPFCCLPLLSEPTRSGFTLPELMMTVAIVVVLAVVALPRYLESRAAARIGARVGEAVAVARECQVYSVSGIGSPPQLDPPDPEQGGVKVEACLPDNAGGTITASWGDARASGVGCLSSTSTDNSAKATLEILPNLTMVCQFD